MHKDSENALWRGKLRKTLPNFSTGVSWGKWTVLCWVAAVNSPFHLSAQEPRKIYLYIQYPLLQKNMIRYCMSLDACLFSQRKGSRTELLVIFQMSSQRWNPSLYLARSQKCPVYIMKNSSAGPNLSIWSAYLMTLYCIDLISAYTTGIFDQQILLEATLPLILKVIDYYPSLYLYP